MFGESSFFKPKTSQMEKNIGFKKLMLASVAALMLALGGNFEAAQAQGKGSGEGKGREQLADLVKDNAKMEDMIIAKMQKLGKRIRINNTEAKMWKSSAGDQVVIGYDKEGRPKWISEEIPDGVTKMTDFDLKGRNKGKASRVIFNRNEEKVKGEKSAHNDLNTFSNMNFLATQAEITASVNGPERPDRTQVFDIYTEAGQRVFEEVNFATGKSNRTEDEEIIKKKDKYIQQSFNENLKRVNAEMEQQK